LTRPLLVVDGDSLAHRAHHGLPKQIRRAEGRPGNALVGFSNFLELAQVLTDPPPCAQTAKRRPEHSRAHRGLPPRQRYSVACVPARRPLYALRGPPPRPRKRRGPTSQQTSAPGVAPPASVGVPRV